MGKSSYEHQLVATAIVDVELLGVEKVGDEAAVDAERQEQPGRQDPRGTREAGRGDPDDREVRAVHQEWDTLEIGLRARESGLHLADSGRGAGRRDQKREED